VFPERMRGRVSDAVKTYGDETNDKTNDKNPDYRLRFVPEITLEDVSVVLLPPWIWKLSQGQAQAILRLVAREPVRPGLTTISAGSDLAGQIQCLAMIAGSAAILDDSCRIVGERAHVIAEDYSVVGYRGAVWCLEVPSHVFYVRRQGCPTWTGNSSRTGNKGICGLAMPATMMPYTAEGIVPDIIVNPHSIPTRMAINQLEECAVAQFAMMYGRTVDGTTFTSANVEAAIRGLRAAGRPLGEKTVMYNPDTGEKMEAILIGPTLYARIAKFIETENYANSSGPTHPVTNQPLRGKARNGGIRFGEMEKDVIVGVGSMLALNQKFYMDSDGTTIYVCRRCNERAVVNTKLNMYSCANCLEYADVRSVASSHTANVFIEELEAMNIGAKIHLEPHRYPTPGTSMN